MTRNNTEHKRVIPMNILKPFMSFSLRATQDFTIVQLDRIKLNVFRVAKGMFKCVSPEGGQTGDPTLKRIYAENNPPNNIISDARNSQIPSLALYNPVSSRGFTL